MAPRVQGFSNIDQWMAANGARPMVSTPKSKWVRGPFYFLFTTTADGTERNLLTAAIITSDGKVDAAWGTSIVPKAILRIESVRLLSASSVLRVAASTEKEIIAHEYQLRAKVGTEERKWSIGQTTDELYKEAVDAATDADIAYLNGTGPVPLESPFEVDLEEDELAIPATTSLAAAYPMLLEVQGWMFDNKSKRDPRLGKQGAGACSLADGLSGTDLVDALAARTAIQPSTMQMPIKTIG